MFNFFIGWSVAVFILLANLSNCKFNVFINDTTRVPITNESLFLYPLCLYKILVWRRRLDLHGILDY